MFGSEGFVKRIRRETPGKKTKRHKKCCLFCERKMARRYCGLHRTDWYCRRCRITFGYISGVLKGIMGPKDEVFWERRWKYIPDGVLVVHEGTEEKPE